MANVMPHNAITLALVLSFLDETQIAQSLTYSSRLESYIKEEHFILVSVESPPVAHNVQ